VQSLPHERVLSREGLECCFFAQTPECRCRGGVDGSDGGDTGEVCVVHFLFSFFVKSFLFLGWVLGAGTGPVAVIILCRVSTRGCGPSP